jgi:hypothetical protein
VAARLLTSDSVLAIEKFTFPSRAREIKGIERTFRTAGHHKLAGALHRAHVVDGGQNDRATYVRSNNCRVWDEAISSAA